MVIFDSFGRAIISVQVDDSSYKFEEIMGDCDVHLEFALTEHVEIEPGSYIFFQGVKYELMSRESVTIQHRRYEYKATFSGPQARFSRYVMYNYQDGRVKFEMIGKPQDFISMVLWNLNEREPNMWSQGAIVNKEERLVSFNHTNIRDALSAIAEAFDTEWGVEPYGAGFAIRLRKNEFNKDAPLALGYGKNQGFKPGVGRVNFGQFGQVERVWIEGGDRNLSLEEYGWTTLHFPRSFSFKIDANGKYFFWVGPVWYMEDGFDSSSALDFVTDEYGASVKLASAASNCVEASLDLTEYYPKRVGTVSDVFYLYRGQYLHFHELIQLEDIDWNEVQVDIIDNSLGSDAGSLDYDLYKFSNDEPLTVIFQSGMLAGREFNATFVKEPMTRVKVDAETGQVIIDPSTGEAEREEVRPGNRFELSRATIDGVDMPNYTFRPNAVSEGSAIVEDSYIVVNCWLPREYVCDYDNFSGAELEALREAAKFIRENKDPQFTFKGQVDDLYAHRNWGSIHDKLVLGGCISFQNSSIQPLPIVTRIVGIKTYVNNPYAPELTLSNETVKGGMSSMIAQLRGDDEHIIEGVKQARRYSQRSFRDAKETIAMLAGAIDYFSEGINPITVETMSLLVGYEALQFRFFSNRACNPPTVDPVHYDADARILTLDSCVIQHMTHGIKEVTAATNLDGTAVRKYYDYIRWSMPSKEFGQTFFVGTDPNTGKSLTDTAYYLYAKVDASNVAKKDEDMTSAEAAHIYGEFVLTTEKKPIKQKLTATDTEYKVIDGVNTEVGYFYLLVGILNSEYEGGRSFAPLYGFTEVLPGQITTDVIRSASGESYFDLANNQFALGNRLTYINNVLKLRGALIVTGGGDNEDPVPIGAWCGHYDPNRVYGPGDEVWEEVNGEIATYRYVNSEPSKGHYVTDTDYWIVVARGKAGNAGAFKSTVFIRTNDNLESLEHVPTGGDFSSPRPTSTHTDSASGAVLPWTDGIPSGEARLWASSCTFASDNTSTGWSIPRPMTDTDTFDVEFAPEQANGIKPTFPTYGTDGTIDNRGAGNNRNDGLYNSYETAINNGMVWFDPDTDANITGIDWEAMKWRAEREKKNGEWGDWVIMNIKGETGAAGQSTFPSTLFVRMNGTPTKPADSAGSFSDPSPANILAGQNAAGQNVYWEDGIPDGEEILWATTRIFTSDRQAPQESSWRTPRQMTDTASYDVEFAKMQPNDGNPPTPSDANRHGGSGTQVWFDPVLDSTQDFKKMYWRAEREKKNGVWGNWTILRIKGEKGDDALALTVDISNEVDGIAVGSDGVLDINVPLSTSVAMYYGSDPETITNISATVPSAFRSKIHVTPNTSTGNISIVIDANTDFSSVAVVNIPIDVTSANGTRTVTYSIIPVKDGEDGHIYRLITSHDVVKGTGTPTTFSPTAVTCQRYAAAGGNAFELSNEGTLKYSVDGGTTQTNYPSSGGVQVSSAVSAGRIIFYWYIGSVLVDRETVPIVSDGANGTGVSTVKIYYGYSMTDSMPTTWTEDTHGDGTDIPEIGPGAWLWIKEVTTYSDGTTKTKYSKSLSGGTAPVSPFLGMYDPDTYYYGCFERTDIVKDSNGQFYRANPLAQTYSSPNQSSPFKGISPGNTAYWLPFIGNYDNIATAFAFIENLVVQRLNTAGEGNNTDKRIVAEGNDLCMYDGTDSDPKMRISGDDLSGFNQSTSVAFGNQTPLARNGSNYNGTGYSYTDQRSTGISIPVGPNENVKPGAVLHLPSIQFNVQGGLSDSYSGDSMGTAMFRFGWMVDGVKVTDASASGWFGRNGGTTQGTYYQAVTIGSAEISLSSGQTHTVCLWCDGHLYGCSDAVGHSWILNAYFSGNINLPISYPIRKTEIGANGFQVAFGSDRMFKCFVSGSTTTFLMESDDAGIEVSSSGSGGTLRIRLGGTWYYAKRTYDSQMQKYFLELSLTQ